MPSLSSATISPSRIASFASICLGRSESSGYCGVISIWLRETNRAWPFFTKQTDRNPSHFVSNIQSGSEKDSSTSVASIGLMTAGMRALRAAEQIAEADFRFMHASLRAAHDKSQTLQAD